MWFRDSILADKLRTNNDVLHAALDRNTANIHQIFKSFWMVSKWDQIVQVAALKSKLSFGLIH